MPSKKELLKRIEQLERANKIELPKHGVQQLSLHVSVVGGSGYLGGMPGWTPPTAQLTLQEAINLILQYLNVDYQDGTFEIEKRSIPPRLAKKQP